MTALAQTLYDKAEEMEEDSADSGVTWLKGIRDAALEAISAGNGASILSGTVLGQTLSVSQSVTHAQLANDAQTALKELQGNGPIRITYAQFDNCAFPH